MRPPEATTAGGELKSEDICSSILFKDMCAALESARKVKGSEDKMMEVLKPIEKLKANSSQSSYPYLRLLCPQLDSKRRQYGLRERMMASLYLDILGLDKSNPDFERLSLFHDAEKNPAHTGDFGATLEDVIKSRCSGQVEHTLGEVNDILEKLVKAPMKPEPGKKTKRDILCDILHKFPPDQQKWLVRMIYKELKIGINSKSVLSFLHPDMVDYHAKTSDLRKACSVFAGRPTTSRVSSQLELGTCFLPMLAYNYKEKLSRILPSLEGDDFVMDVKLDGERILLHKIGDDVKLFTRNRVNYTEKYGHLVKDLICHNINAENCILDGEMCSWDVASKRMVPFGHNRTVALEEDFDVNGAADESNGMRKRNLFFVVFDIIYAEGGGVMAALKQACRDSPQQEGMLGQGLLLEVPLDVRRRLLTSMMTEVPHRLEMVKHMEVRTKDEGERQELLQDYFNTMAVFHGEEGLVVKKLSSPYCVGMESRKKGFWVKMKPDYTDSTQPLDLVILAVFWAKGAFARGKYMGFMLGCRAEAHRPGKYYTCGKVGSGYTTAELDKLIQTLEHAGLVTMKNGEEPDYLVDVGGRPHAGDNKPAKWVKDPANSVVVEIRAAEITFAGDFTARLCPRFPRVMAIRHDKAATECEDINTMREQLARQSRSNIEMGGVLKNKKGSEKKKKGKKRKLEVTCEGNLAGLGEVKQLSNAFMVEMVPLNICVLMAGDKVTKYPRGEWTKKGRKRLTKTICKTKLQKDIIEGGGVVWASYGNNDPGAMDFIVVSSTGIGADRDNAQVKNLLKSKKECNIVHYQWVKDVEEAGAFVCPTFFQFRRMKKDMADFMKMTHNELGLKKGEKTTPGEMKQAMQAMLQLDAKQVSKSGKQYHISQYEESQLHSMPSFMFKRCVFYLDQYGDMGELEGQAQDHEREKLSHTGLMACAINIKARGGAVSAHLCKGVTHVVLDRLDFDRKKLIRERVEELTSWSTESGSPHIRLVYQDWVDHCVKLGHLEPPLAEHQIPLQELWAD
ncbi:unnamed protein product [Chrysoparadoxa australica]